MTYTASELERSFKKVARARYGKQYENDAGYWTGGRCNWGGSHSLNEDCQTFANGFNKISNLRDIKEELNQEGRKLDLILYGFRNQIHTEDTLLINPLAPSFFLYENQRFYK